MFTLYERMAQQGEAERLLRNRGLLVVDRSVPAFTTQYHDVTVRQVQSHEQGRWVTRWHYQTPAGDLTTAFETEDGITRCTEKMFKTPSDYPALLALIRSMRFQANHAAVAKRQARWGGDGICRVAPGLEPMQQLISGDYLDMAEWAMQWMENQDEVLKLYDALVEKRREVYPILAQSPAEIVNYGGNVTVQIIGPSVFEQYYLPHYHELADALKGTGKKLGCHFDGDCRVIEDLIAATPLDYIEAFTPAPDTDMTLAEARQAWPGKTLWINFPSSVHLHEVARVRQTAEALLEAVDPRQRFVMAITEDVPEHRRAENFSAIMEAMGL